MRLGDILILGIGWLARHPRSITGVLPSPLTRAGARTTYNAQNSGYDFDADLRNWVRTNYSTYASDDDTTLQGKIDVAMPDSDIIEIDMTVDPPE